MPYESFAAETRLTVYRSAPVCCSGVAKYVRRAKTLHACNLGLESSIRSFDGNVLDDLLRRHVCAARVCCLQFRRCKLKSKPRRWIS